MINRIKARSSKAERASWMLFFACWIAYAIISMSKSAYSAAIAPIVQSGVMEKSQAGLINSGFYLLYGMAQLLGAKLVDKVSPIVMVSFSLIGAAVTSLAMAFADGFLSMFILWSLCGLLQFAMYPAILRVLAEYLLDEHKGKAMVYISFSYCAGSLLNYLGSAMVLKFFDWRMIFVFSAAVIVLILILWIFISKKTSGVLLGSASAVHVDKSESQTQPEQSLGIWKMLMGSGLIMLLISSFVRTALDVGVKAWVPTMITENYAVSASFANILTMVLLLINMSGVLIASYFYPKKVKNVCIAFGLCFAISVPMMVALLMIGKIPVWLVVVLLTGITTCMYTGYQYNYVVIPSAFSKYNRVGSAASIMNAIASFGAVAANFGFGYLAEHTGWSGTIFSWIIMAVVAVAFSFMAAPIWKKFNSK